jgi:hypothetical protein
MSLMSRRNGQRWQQLTDLVRWCVGIYIRQLPSGLIHDHRGSARN